MASRWRHSPKNLNQDAALVPDLLPGTDGQRERERERKRGRAEMQRGKKAKKPDKKREGERERRAGVLFPLWVKNISAACLRC